ncbi:MAG: DNA adenine methylase, partial [Syntrophomonadaceae bacterium]|nr:DNA adenine methylase [Syntrophomonadaceae bacterium]
ESFGEEDQIRLAKVFRKLAAKGCYVMLSNSDTEFVRELYAGFNITTVYAKRAITCRGDRRGPIAELVIRNYT